MTDFEQARLGMVFSQLRPNQVTDPALLAAMGSLARELFVPKAKRDFAYLDASLDVLPSRDGARGALPPAADGAGKADPACRDRAFRHRARYWLCHRLFDVPYSRGSRAG